MERNLEGLTQAPSAEAILQQKFVELEMQARSLLPQKDANTERACLKIREGWFWARHALELQEARDTQIQQAASRIVKP